MIANALTALRLFAAVPVAWALARPGVLPPGVVALGVSVAIGTDLLDGVAARSMGTASPRGRLFDHTTDFVFVTSALAGAAASGWVPVLLPVLIAAAFMQYVIDSYWLLKEKQLRMSRLGRLNGILYFVPVVVLGVADLAQMVVPWARLIQVISWALVAMTLASIVDRALAPTRHGAATLRQGSDPAIGDPSRAEERR